MSPLDPPVISAHNLKQKRYYERAFKPNLVPTGSPYLVRQLDELLRFSGIAPGDHVLELGCGMGRYTFLLADRGIRVEGLDLTPGLLDDLRARDGGKYGIPLHCADVIDFPDGREGTFDAVVGLFVLHHLHDMERCFRAMARLVRPGGRVAFLEPNPYNPLFYLQILVTPGMTWEGDRGMLRMRRRVVLGALERAGFGRLAMTRFGLFPPFLANRPWGQRWEPRLERVVPFRSVLPFQMFRGELA